MKDKLEVGMYCYNKTNRKMGIGKIISFQSNNNVNVRYKNDIELVSIGNLEASYNIIDLIEEKDYVNGVPVEGYYTRYDEEKDDYIKIGIITLEDYWKGTFTSIEDIKSIVTKEQFESLEYKVD